MSEEFKLSRRGLMLGASATAALLAAAPVAAEDKAAAPDLTGKSIFITGSSSGFGRLGAEYYARLGAKVFATMRNLPRSEGDELKALASSDDLDITVIELDVRSDAQVASAVRQAEAAAGGALDVLVNNAGIAFSGPVEAQDIQATELIFDTNVFGPQRLARAVLPAMRKAGRGQIINVSSQLGRLVIPGFGQYSPSKFALEAMSEQMAYEIVAQGIEVTIIQPGGYPTDIWDNQVALSTDLKQRLPKDLVAAYPALTARMDASSGGGGDTDPMDVPRAIARVIAMPAGMRPLRIPVHPGNKPQVPINKVSKTQQLAMLGESPLGPMLKAVLK